MADTRDELYIGYEPKAPAGLAAKVRKTVLLLLLGTAAIGIALAMTQNAFDDSTFEFGVVRSFEGIVHLQPYPRLLVNRAGKAGNRSSYLLVAPGKKGASELLEGMEGHRVNLRGSLIYRQDQTMIEVVPGSVGAIEGAVIRPVPAARSLGEHRLVGEIVDSKCFLGVMKPGNGKPHRACASLCIRGGIPPLLIVREAKGSLPATYLLLVGTDGRALNSEILDLLGRPVEVKGEVREGDGIRTLRVEPEGIRLLD